AELVIEVVAGRARGIDSLASRRIRQVNYIGCTRCWCAGRRGNWRWLCGGRQQSLARLFQARSRGEIGALRIPEIGVHIRLCIRRIQSAKSNRRNQEQREERDQERRSALITAQSFATLQFHTPSKSFEEPLLVVVADGRPKARRGSLLGIYVRLLPGD